jgi:hypothetical protein
VTAAVEFQSYVADALDAGDKCLIYLTDLSSAFNLIRLGIFAEKAKNLISESMTHLIVDFITERKAFVQVGESSSSTLALSPDVHRTPLWAPRSSISTAMT